MTSGDRVASATLSAVVITALVVHQRIDDLLSAIHPPGSAAHGIADLTPLTERPTVAGAQAVLDGWLDPVVAAPGLPSAREVAHVALGLDFLLAISVPLLLWRLLTHVRGHLMAAGATDQPAASYLTMVTAALWALIGLGAADIGENFGLLATIDDGPHKTILCVTWFLSIAKWSFLTAILLPLVVSSAWLLLRAPKRSQTLRTLAAVRVQLVLVIGFAFLLFGPILGPQAADVILRWIDEWDDGLVGGLATILLAALLWLSCRWLVHLEQTATPTQLSPFALPLLGVVLIIVGGVADATIEHLRGLWPLGILMLVIGVLDLTVSGLDDHAPRLALGARRTLAPELVAGAVPILAGVAIVRATSAEWLYAGDGDYALVVLGGLALEAIGWSLIARGRSIPTALSKGAWGVVAGGGALACFTAWRVLANPWRTGDFLGLLGVYAAAGCVLALIAGVVALEHHWRPPPAAAAFRVRRMPLVALIAAWAVAAAVQDKGGYHDVRVLDAKPKRVLLADAWKTWLHSHTWPKPAKGERPAVPLVLVAASGGGIRAAFWTAQAMNCAIDGRADRRCGGPRPKASAALFAASGTSGGSVGLAEWAANRLHGDPGAWVGDRLGEDFLTPTLAWTLFADLPSGLLHTDFGPDRAEVLERAWEQSWTERDRSIGALLWHGGASSDGDLAKGLLAAGKKLPLLMFGSTSVRDGCRIVVSRLESADPPSSCVAAARKVASGIPVLSATEDAFDLCPDHDLRLSSAALLSARFPIVSPSGRLGASKCGGGPVFGVDGGYFDNTAASPLMEMWDSLEPMVDEFNRRHPGRCVVPVLLQLDNAYVDPQPPEAPKRPWELAAPLQTFGATRGGREAETRQAAAVRFARSAFGSVDEAHLKDGSVVSRYAQLYPVRHPGTTAPLGWTLSEPSMTSLRKQIYGGDNEGELTKVSRWFDTDLRCAEARLPRTG
jgi:hypothetical protein